MQEQEKNQFWYYFHKIEPFVSTALAGMLPAFITHPIDTLKTRIQIFSEQRALNPENAPKFTLNMGNSAKFIWQTEGWWGFYKGIDAMQLRMVLYSPARLGSYKWFMKYVESKHPDHEVSFLERCFLSGVAGAISAIFMNPADLCLIRFQADNSLPVELRRNYKHVFDALFQIIKYEGVLHLWTGIYPQMCRNMMINMGQLVTLDETKKILNKYSDEKNTFAIRMTASAFAGSVAPIVAMPFDNIKTKIQKMKPDQNGQMPYKGVFDCLIKSVKREGFFRLWIGIDAFFFRAGIHIFLTSLLMEYLPEFWNKLEGKH